MKHRGKDLHAAVLQTLRSFPCPSHRVVLRLNWDNVSEKKSHKPGNPIHTRARENGQEGVGSVMEWLSSHLPEEEFGFLGR